MPRKKETACKAYPGRFLASGSTLRKYNTNSQAIPQALKIFRRKSSSLIIRLSLWGMLPITWAEKLMEGLRHE